MKRVALTLLVVAVAACQENVTGPAQSRIGASGANHFLSLHPPPPVDTGVVATTTSGSALLNVMYFLNVPGNNGFLAFQPVQPAGTVASPDARVSFHQGTFDGRGTVSFQVPNGAVTIDLSSVSPLSSFEGCSEGCFDLSFDKVILTTPEGGTKALDGASFHLLSERKGTD